MAVRDLFAPVERPAVPPPMPAEPLSWGQRWPSLRAVVAERWGQQKVYWFEMRLAQLHKLIEASGRASNAAWAAALEDLRASPECPGNIPAWMASALERAIDHEKHKPREHTANEGDVTARKNRAYRRIAGLSRPGDT